MVRFLHRRVVATLAAMALVAIAPIAHATALYYAIDVEFDNPELGIVLGAGSFAIDDLAIESGLTAVTDFTWSALATFDYSHVEAGATAQIESFDAVSLSLLAIRSNPDASLGLTFSLDTTVFGIDDGVFIEQGTYSLRQVDAMIPNPEPSAGLLFGVGLLVISRGILRSSRPNA